MALRTVEEALLLVGTIVVGLPVPSPRCLCVSTGPEFLRDIYCKAKFVIQAEIKNNVLETQNETDPNGLPVFAGIRERRLDIETIKVYKTSPEFDAVSEKNSLYISLESAACGVSLGEGNKYIISGEISDGKLRLSWCSSFWREVHELTDEQLSGLSYVYDRGCKDCQIEYCEGKIECYRRSWSDRSCAGDQEEPNFRCYDKYASCEVSKMWFGTGCHWVPSSQAKLSTCLNKPQVTLVKPNDVY